MASSSLAELLGLAQAKITASALLPEADVLDLAYAIIEVAARDVSSPDLSPEVFSVGEALLKLCALIAPTRD